MSENLNSFKENVELALNFQNNGKISEAEKIYLDLLEKYPDNFDVLNLLGVLYFHSDNYTKAIAYISKAIQIKPMAISYNNLGHSFAAVKSKDKAILAYQKALELNPAYVEVYFNLAKLFQEKNETEKAIFCYQEIIKINPENAEAL